MQLLFLLILTAVGAFIRPPTNCNHNDPCWNRKWPREKSTSKAEEHHGPVRLAGSNGRGCRCLKGRSALYVRKPPSFIFTKDQEEFGLEALLQEGSKMVMRNTKSLPPRYVRWSPQEEDDSVNNNNLRLQTAVTTWTKEQGDQKLFLHAQVHVGSQEYYDYYRTDPIFLDDSTTTLVLYELLVDDTLLTYDGNVKGDALGGIMHKVQASAKDQALARQYGWVCQANVIDYARRNWYHADFTRQEYYSAQQQRQRRGYNDPSDRNGAVNEAATALFVGPPLSSNRASRRRIFTNLFLPGNSLALFLRAILWVAVPSPELSILLLDWSSTWQQEEGSAKSSKGQISPIAKAVLQSIAYGKWNVARQLVFGQVLIAGHKAGAAGLGATDPETASMGERNDRALAAADQVFRTASGASDDVAVVHLLYGCNHCPDLHQKLQARGFTCQGVDWRTVWTASIGGDAATTATINNDGTQWKTLIAIGVVGYLGIDGADWISTVHDIVSAPDAATGGLATLLYLLRHLGLYLGLSKCLLDMEEMANTNANCNR
jgi:hypothetical protein